MHRLFKVLGKIFRFFVFSFALTFVLLGVFYLQTDGIDTFRSLVYVVAIPTYYYVILVLITLLFSPLGLSRYSTYLLVVPKALFDIFLLSDIFVFRIYRFHIDMMFVNMLVHDFQGIGLSTIMLLVAVFAGLVLIAFNVWMYKLALAKKKFSLIWINSAILTLFLLGQFIHIWAYDYNKKDITKYTPYFPYYFPTISHSLVQDLQKRFPQYFPKPVYNADKKAKDLLRSTASKDAIFKYPSAPLQFTDTSKQKPNILVFLTESWRSDMMTPKVTPHIYNFSRNTYNYLHHTSTGNVTVSGLFGLMYGLHPSYLSYAQADPFENQSILTKALQDQGYDIAVYTPSNLDRFALKAMFFGAIKDSKYHYQKSLSAVENDRYVVDLLKKDIQTDSLQKPWFKFVFLNASHHNYNYPKEHELFLPVPSNSEGFIFDKDIDATPFVNDYKNSLHYVDSLFEEILDVLKDQETFDNTLIVVSSDHGEEFNDNKEGYWGHGSNFTQYQTSVPFLLKLPDSTVYKEITTPSGHIDFVPTILYWVLGVQNKVTDFSSGNDLLHLPNEDRGFIISSYVDKAYVVGANVYTNGISFTSYQRNDIKRKNTVFDYKALNLLREAETRFLGK